MSKIFIAVALVVALVVPASASAAPTRSDVRNAAKECRAELGTTAAEREAFRARYGTKKGRNAFGRCVARRALDELRERRAAVLNAARECRAERGATSDSIQAFREKYGTNRNKRNAFGKCVSQKTQENLVEADAQDVVVATARKNAARQCGEERGTTLESIQAFRQKYGTNRNRRNAFGKCVSQLAKAQLSQPAPTSS